MSYELSLDSLNEAVAALLEAEKENKTAYFQILVLSGFPGRVFAPENYDDSITHIDLLDLLAGMLDKDLDPQDVDYAGNLTNRGETEFALVDGGSSFGNDFENTNKQAKKIAFQALAGLLSQINPSFELI